MTEEERADYRAAVQRAIKEGKAPWTYVDPKHLPQEGDHLVVREVVQRANEIRRRQIEDN